MRDLSHPTRRLHAFLAFEDAVLPLLREHGGELRQRLRTQDARVEIHVIWFPSSAALDAYRADPRRTAHRDFFEASGTEAEVLTVVDVRNR